MLLPRPAPGLPADCQKALQREDKGSEHSCSVELSQGTSESTKGSLERRALASWSAGNTDPLLITHVRDTQLPLSAAAPRETHVI